MEDAVERERKAGLSREMRTIESFREELRKLSEEVDEIVQRGVHTVCDGFDPSQGFGSRYEVRVRFDSRLVRDLSCGAQEAVADAVARRVRYEVARAKFIEEAR